jgi:Raf kinase inhibitor-like YbhB/YbcL family protein
MFVRLPISFLVLTASSVLATPASAQIPFMKKAPLPFVGPALAEDRVISRAVGSLQVTSPVVNADGDLPLTFTGYGKSTSFPISWSPVTDAKAYAVVMEELDLVQRRVTTFWVAYNIPADTTALGHAIHTKAEILGPKGLLQGLNSMGGVGYIGPHPPEGDPAHHYHVQVFALRRMLPLKGGASLDQVIQVMNERVLAEGDLIVNFTPPRPGDLPNGKPAPAAKS